MANSIAFEISCHFNRFGNGQTGDSLARLMAEQEYRGRRFVVVAAPDQAVSVGRGLYILDGLNYQLGVEKPHVAETFEVRRSPR